MAGPRQPQSQYYSAVCLLLSFIQAYFIGQTTGLPCHCRNNSPCDQSNGFCPGGCEIGWYGPGCQIGNLALNKTAAQSSTYIDIGETRGIIYQADFAVDGLFPAASNTSSISCSHTSAKNTDGYDGRNAWLYVLLSRSEAFVLTSINIVNRQGINGQRLRNFYILYTTDSVDPPNPATWSRCAYEQNTLSGVLSRNYTCQDKAIGRKVAVYLNTDPRLSENENVLTLCELYIYGYAVVDCKADYTGPGCLLRKYNSSICLLTPNTTRGDFDGCRFLTCPNKGFLPPDCWITLPDLSNSSVQVSANINSLRVSAQQPTSKSNYPATSLIVNVSTPVSSQAHILNLTPSSSIVEVNLTGYAGQAYTFSVTPLSCNAAGSQCVSGQASCAVTLETWKENHQLFNNSSCLFLTVSSSTAGCEIPSSISIRCNAVTIAYGSVTTNFSDISCGLGGGLMYNCFVVATTFNGYRTASTTISVVVPGAAILVDSHGPMGMDVSSQRGSTCIPSTDLPACSSVDTRPMNALATRTTDFEIAVLAGSITGALLLGVLTGASISVLIRSSRHRHSWRDDRHPHFEDTNTIQHASTDLFLEEMPAKQGCFHDQKKDDNLKFNGRESHKAACTKGLGRENTGYLKNEHYQSLDTTKRNEELVYSSLN